MSCDIFQKWEQRLVAMSPIYSIFLAHLAFRPCELLPSLFVCHPSVNISHFILLLINHWANCNQTLVEWSLGGPLPKLCPVIPTSNQDGRQAKNRKKGGWNFLKNLLLWNYWANFNQTLLKWSMGGPLPICVQHFRPLTKMATTAKLNLT
jgi:hypothetical protein